MPVPLVALISATGVPSCFASNSTSTWPPCFFSSSAMFSSTRVGSSKRDHARRQHQVAFEMSGIEDEQYAVWLGRCPPFRRSEP